MQVTSIQEKIFYALSVVKHWQREDSAWGGYTARKSRLDGTEEVKSIRANLPINVQAACCRHAARVR
jgi:hypothetical protein